MSGLGSNTERLSLLSRDFESVQDSGHLLELMAEAGCLLAKLMLAGVVQGNDFFIEKAKDCEAQKQGPPDSALSDFKYWTFFSNYADTASDRQRTLLHKQNAFTGGLLSTTDWSTDYAAQGRRYALFLRELLADLVDVKPMKKSRVQPDKAITVWMRKNLHKYATKKAAVQAYVEIHELPKSKVNQLYTAYYNDRKKSPNPNPVKSAPKRAKKR